MKIFPQVIVDFIIPGLIILFISIFIYFIAYPLNLFFIKSFLASPLFNPLITILVGSIALILYKKAKNDFKKDAANILLLEIENAERLLKQVIVSINQEFTPTLPEFVYLMKTESWSKYRYLFVRDFSWNEWNVITDFYNRCQLYDAAVNYNKSFFQKNEEQIRINLHKILAKYTEKYTDKIVCTKNIKVKEELQKEYLEIRQQFIDRYMEKTTIYLYSPQKPVTDAKEILSGMSKDISLGTIGIKLKTIAEKKD